MTPATVGRFIRDLRRLAQILIRLPEVDRSADPADNFLLAMAQAAKAEYLVSGDQCGVLSLKRHGATRIIRARELLDLLGLKAPPPAMKRKARK